MILLTTLNARYSHASLGLRCLLANMGDLRSETELLEFVIGDRPEEIVEAILAKSPSVVGMGVYIWNAEESARVVALLKQVAPEVIVVIGGPEVSYEYEDQAIFHAADYLICGPGDLAFAELCRQLLKGERPPKVISASPPPLDAIRMPYGEYDDRDIAHRVLYVEASRGCPFKCEFCLSSLDKTARPFPLDEFLDQMDSLYRRGARQFKFVDRTFNLNIKVSLRILEFFLERLDDRLFLHFEVIPDHLPDALKDAIARFPAGSLQFEVGVQTWDPEVQARISRRQDNVKTDANLRWLRQHSHAHLHTDLIVGLPGETLETFGQGFDRLVGLDPHEIQVGILKRLRGAPIDRHSEVHRIRYNPRPPYTIVRSDALDFVTLQQLGRFARYWDLVGNSGRFGRSRKLLLGDAPFANFWAFTAWLHGVLGKTHQIAADRLYDLVYRWLVEQGLGADVAAEAVGLDFRDSGTRSIPAFLQHRPLPRSWTSVQARKAKAQERQARHLPPE